MNIHKRQKSNLTSELKADLVRAFSEFYPSSGYQPVSMASFEPEMFDTLDDGAGPLNEIAITQSILGDYQPSIEMC